MPAEPIIYLDYHATTPCDPRVVEAMLPTLTEVYGNPSSRQHAAGGAAAELVDAAREQIAELIGASAREIVFTSGATEADNLAIKGVALRRGPERGQIITSQIAHKAVLDPCQRLERLGFEITYLEVDSSGCVRVEDVERALDQRETCLVSLLHANNEIGTLNPVREIGALCRERGVHFHCDAVQALPYLPCDVEELQIDLLSISAHKMYGPKGVGALYVRRRQPRVRLEPLLDGGGHERGLRPGTLNVPGIVGLGKACELVRRERESDAARVGELRDRLLAKLLEAVPETIINGSLERRLPNNINVSFPGVDAEGLLESVRGVAFSSGAACSSATADGSYVLKAIGRRERSSTKRDALARSSVRLGLGRFTTVKEVDAAAAEIIAAARSPRARIRQRPSCDDDPECASPTAPTGTPDERDERRPL